MKGVFAVRANVIETFALLNSLRSVPLATSSALYAIIIGHQKPP